MNTKQSYRIFGVILGACIFCSLLQTVMNTALPAIMAEFAINAATAQWLTSGYSLAMGVMTPLTAFLIKRFPTKRLFSVALIICCAGVALAVWAGSFPVLMCGRILQAIGASVIASMTQVVIFHIFPAEKRGSIMGMYGLAVGAAPILAPTLAGVVIDLWGWRMVFGISLAIAAVAVVLGIWMMRNVLPTQRLSFDFLSMAECSVGLTGIMIGLGNITSHPFFGVFVALPLLIGAVSLMLFWKRQQALEEPYLNLQLFKNREFTCGTIGSMLLYAGMIGASSLIPLYVQSVRGLSATVSGVVTMPGSLVMIFINPIAGKLYDKMGIRKLFLTGSALMLAGCLGLSFLTMETPLLWVVTLFVIRQIAVGVVMMPLATWAMSSMEKSATADGTAILASLRTIAGSIGAAVFVSLSSSVAANAAQIDGINAAFMGISAVAAAELLFAVYLAGNPKVAMKG